MTEPHRIPVPDDVDLSKWGVYSGCTRLSRGVQYYEELGILIIDGTYPQGVCLRPEDPSLSTLSEIVVIEPAAGKPTFGHGIEAVEVWQGDGFAYYVDGHFIAKGDYRPTSILQAFGIKISVVHAMNTAGMYSLLSDLTKAEDREVNFQFQRWAQLRAAG